MLPDRRIDPTCSPFLRLVGGERVALPVERTTDAADVVGLDARLDGREQGE